MNPDNTLTRSWISTLHGYPIRVEEHARDLSYIIEFYDAQEGNDGQRISHCPITGETLTITALFEEELQVLGL